MWDEERSIQVLVLCVLRMKLGRIMKLRWRQRRRYMIVMN
jgi:hypothetical protein